MKIILKIVLITLSFVLFYAPGFADKVGQGAGLAENNILFVYENLDKYLNYCLALQDCAENAQQQQALQKILSHLPQERVNNSAQIRFKSQREDPQLFFIDGQIRVAVTWAHIGAPIYFNLDMIYKNTADGRVEGISLATASSLLVHELGHHHGYKNHDWLDRLGARVARALHGRVYSSVLSPDKSNILAHAIYFDEQNINLTSSQLLLSDGQFMYDFTSDIMGVFQFRCPQAPNKQVKLIGLSIWNLTWRGIRTTSPYILALAELHCLEQDSSGESKLVKVENFGIRLNMGIDWQSFDRVWRLNKRTFNLQQVTCEQEPLICNYKQKTTNKKNEE